MYKIFYTQHNSLKFTDSVCLNVCLNVCLKQ